MHEVAPSAVSTADAIDMMIWVINLIVSFLVIRIIGAAQKTAMRQLFADLQPK
jgi:hypothetical protein